MFSFFLLEIIVGTMVMVFSCLVRDSVFILIVLIAATILAGYCVWVTHSPCYCLHSWANDLLCVVECVHLTQDPITFLLFIYSGLLPSSIQYAGLTYHWLLSVVVPVYCSPCPIAVKAAFQGLLVEHALAAADAGTIDACSLS